MESGVSTSTLAAKRTDECSFSLEKRPAASLCRNTMAFLTARVPFIKLANVKLQQAFCAFLKHS
jgi:hypothetical protein